MSDEAIEQMEARVETKLDEISFQAESYHDEFIQRIHRMDETLRGNGQPGVVTRLAVMDEKIAALTAFAEEVQGFKRWVMLGVISLIASMLIQSLGILP